mgnify:CR=1 FL=1
MKNESDADQTLLIADEYCENEEDTQATFTTRQIGILAYRTLYKEFWYRLGHVLLAHSPSPTAAMVSEDDEESDMDSEPGSDGNSKKRKKPKESQQPFSSNRFQLEKVRDLILRMTELVSVGQPDLRAAATVAVLQLAKACVERTAELERQRFAVLARLRRRLPRAARRLLPRRRRAELPRAASPHEPHPSAAASGIGPPARPR